MPPFYESPNVKVNNKKTISTNNKYSFDLNDIFNDGIIGEHLKVNEQKENYQNGNDTQMCLVEEASTIFGSFN